MKIGLYFGSFNPVHHGHLILANYIAQNTDLDKIWFVVSPQNPLKQQSSLLNEYHRLHLINLAIDGERNLQTSDIEFKLPKPSYTIDTLTYLNEKYPEHQFTIIMGSDSYQNIKNWKNWETLTTNYPILIYIRPKFEKVELRNNNHNIINAPLLDISSTTIRAQIKNKKSVRFLLPDVVNNEIEKAGYYK